MACTWGLKICLEKTVDFRKLWTFFQSENLEIGRNVGWLHESGFWRFFAFFGHQLTWKEERYVQSFFPTLKLLIGEQKIQKNLNYFCARKNPTWEWLKRPKGMVFVLTGWISVDFPYLFTEMSYGWNFGLYPPWIGANLAIKHIFNRPACFKNFLFGVLWYSLRWIFPYQECSKGVFFRIALALGGLKPLSDLKKRKSMKSYGYGVFSKRSLLDTPW